MVSHNAPASEGGAAGKQRYFRYIVGPHRKGVWFYVDRSTVRAGVFCSGHHFIYSKMCIRDSPYREACQGAAPFKRPTGAQGDPSAGDSEGLKCPSDRNVD